MAWLRRIHRRLPISPRLSLLISTCTVLAIIFWGVPAAANWPRLQYSVVRLVNALSSWDIAFDHLHWSPWQATVAIDNLRVTNSISEHALTATNVQWHYKPLALARGVFRISDLRALDIALQLDKMQAGSSTAPRATLSLRQFLLLEHIQLDAINLERIRLTLPNTTSAHIASARLRFHPGWFGTAALTLRIKNTVVQPAHGDPVTIQQLDLGGESKLSNWLQHAPYVNDFRGSLRARNLTWRTLVTQKITAATTIADGRVTLNDLRVKAYDRLLRGDGHLEFGTHDSALALEWPAPLPIPELLPDSSFWRTAGTLQGRVAWRGNFPTLLTPTGTLDVDLTHIARDITTVPAHLVTTAQWTNGVMQLDHAQLQVGSGTANISGSIDLPQQHIDLRANASQLSLPGVLGRFRTVYYHPVTGEGDFQAHFRGWARDFTLDLTANSHGPMAYQGIVVDRADIQMQLTYPQLTLDGAITQAGRETGRAHLKTTFGPKPSDGGSRPATMQLTADITNHPLDTSFALYGLKGTGSGQMRIDGLSTAYRGTGSVTLSDGTWYVVPFEQLRSAVQFRPSELLFSDLQVHLRDIPAAHWTGGLRMTMQDGMHLTGAPTPGSRIDLAYHSPTQQWSMRDITWTELGTGHRVQVTGGGKTGAWDVHVSGSANAQWLMLLPATFRDASGTLPINVHLRGDLEKPLVSGTVQLQRNVLTLRALPYEWRNVTGNLLFTNNRVQLRDVHGAVGDGEITLNGWATTDWATTNQFQLQAVGTNIPWTSEDRTIRADLDLNATISRNDSSHTTISGALDIGNALYRRDFLLFEQTTRNARLAAREKQRQIDAGWDHIRLALTVRSHGDVLIRNNVATAGLRIHGRLSGSAANPVMTGAIETTDGVLQYLGLKFNLTRGTINFFPNSSEPDLDFSGEENVGAYRVQVTLRGSADNLRVDLTSIPGEDHKNILCLIGYGVTCDQLRTSQFAAKLGPSVLAEQLARILERPIRKATGLDIVRIESAVGTSDLSRLHVGKQITERFELGFVTTVGQSVADQSIEAAYKVSDNFLLKAAQSTGRNTEAKISVRLRER